jgi:hypothetical protein
MQRGFILSHDPWSGIGPRRIHLELAAHGIGLFSIIGAFGFSLNGSPTHLIWPFRIADGAGAIVAHPSGTSPTASHVISACNESFNDATNLVPVHATLSRDARGDFQRAYRSSHMTRSPGFTEPSESIPSRTTRAKGS